jgi:hypothetical protein
MILSVHHDFAGVAPVPFAGRGGSGASMCRGPLNFRDYSHAIPRHTNFFASLYQN